MPPGQLREIDARKVKIVEITVVEPAEFNLGWLPGMMRPGEQVTIDRRPYRKHGNIDPA